MIIIIDNTFRMNETWTTGGNKNYLNWNHASIFYNACIKIRGARSIEIFLASFLCSWGFSFICFYLFKLNNYMNKYGGVNGDVSSSFSLYEKNEKKKPWYFDKKNCERARKKFLYASLHFFFNLFLTLWWRRSLSYRNQSIGLFCKSMGWFLYGRDLSHERVKGKCKLCDAMKMLWRYPKVVWATNIYNKVHVF